MATVTHSVVDPIGNQPAVVEAIRVRLVSGAASPVVYRDSDGAQVRVDERQVLASGANSWSVSLIKQSELRPLGSRYEVDQFLVIPGSDERQVSTLAFTVPDGPGPFRLVDCLVTGTTGASPIVASLNPRKVYDPAITYNRLDVVAYNSKSYVALGTHTGQTPPVSGANDYWQLLGAVEASNGTAPDASTGTKGLARILAGTADAPRVPWASIDDVPAGGDLPEATQTARTSALGTPANLLGKINRYDTSSAAINQTLPAATAGAVAAFGWDAADANLANALTLTAAGSDVIGTGSSASLVVPLLGDLIVLHCTTAGRWRITGGHTRKSALDRQYAKRTTFFDDYAGKPNGGLPALSDSGHALYPGNTNGTSVFDPIVSSEALAINPAGAPGTWAAYTNADLGATVTRIGAEFETGPFTTPNGSIGIILWGEHFVGGGAGVTTPCHFGITPTGWSFMSKAPGLNGNLLTKTAEGSLAVPLVAGTRYRCDILLDRTTSQAFIFLPDGTIAVVNDPAIAAVAGTVVCFEPFGQNATTDPKFRVRRTWADANPAAQVPPQGGASLRNLLALYAAMQRQGAADVQVFTASGTWSKPAGRSTVRVLAFAGGSGGGSGRRGAAGTGRGGGGGGGGGGKADVTLRASDLASTVNVTVGAGGAGGAGAATDDSDGAPGVVGGMSIFGNFLVTARAGTVAAGAGTTAGGTAGNAGNGGTSAGAAGGLGGLGQAGTTGGGSLGGSNGGGGGGGISAANAAFAGGAASDPPDSNASYAAGANTGGNGVSATTRNPGQGGGGGSGGGANPAGAGGNGGSGGSYGGGGGGGGASLNGSASGAGGAGGPGVVVVIST